MHVTQDAWEVAKNNSYLQVRREIVVDLLLPATTFNLVTSAPVTGFDAPPTLAVPGASCVFQRGQQVALDRYGLTMSRYGCSE
jgi:hypothetical protein